MDTIQAMLGQALLVLIGVVVVLLTLILLLVEANLILRLTGQLTKRLEPPDDRAPAEPITKEEED